MAGKNWLTYAPEATFGTAPSSGWADIEVADLGGHTPVVAVQQSAGIVRGQIGPSLQGRRTIVRGATGTLKPNLTTRGMLALFAAAIGDPTITALGGGVNRLRFDLDDQQPSTSLAVQVGREFKNGTQDKDTFTGGQPVTLTMAQGLAANSSGSSTDGIPTVELDMNYSGFQPSVTERTSTLVDSVNYSGGDFTAWVAPTLSAISASECFNEFSIVIPTGFDFDDRCISTLARDRAGRAGRLLPTLQLGRAYKDRSFYNAWINGTPMAFRGTWSLTDDGVPFKVTVEVPSMSFTGDAPQESPEAVATQGIPAEVNSITDNLGNPLPMVSVIVETDETWTGAEHES